MTTMPIDNHPLTQRRLQFIGISVNKLTIKSIKINFFEQKKSFWNTITVSNILNPDQARQNVGPDLGPNCLQGLPADGSSRHSVYSISSIFVINSSSFNFVTFIVN